jgi:Uma2 family endonuclease
MHMHAFRRQWTVEDLHDMPDDGQRYEVIDGELFVTPSPSADHQHALSLLFRLIADYVDRERIGHAFFSPSDITFSPRRAGSAGPVRRAAREWPSAAIIRRHEAANVSRRGPVTSTAHLDRVKKRKLYREEGVSEFWIVDTDARTFERSTPSELNVELVDIAMKWWPQGASTPLVLDVPAYFAKVLDS